MIVQDYILGTCTVFPIFQEGTYEEGNPRQMR